MSLLPMKPEILAYHEHAPYLKFYIVFKFEAQDLMQLNTHTLAPTSACTQGAPVM